MNVKHWEVLGERISIAKSFDTFSGTSNEQMLKVKAVGSGVARKHNIKVGDTITYNDALSSERNGWVVVIESNIKSKSQKSKVSAIDAMAQQSESYYIRKK